MKKKVHIIMATENGKARTLVVRKSRLLAGAIMVVFLVILFSASLWVAGNSLLDQRERRQHVAQLEVNAKYLMAQNKRLLAQVERNRVEKQQHMRDAVTLLNERSTQLENILVKVGVVVPASVPDDGDGDGDGGFAARGGSDEGSGGPFIAAGNVSEANDADGLLVYSEQLRALASQVPLGLPAQGYLSSSFGRRIDPINGRKGFHSGIDIANNVGTKVHATASGTVIRCGVVNGYGRMVKIANGAHFSTVFGHLNKIMVKNGDIVARGDVVGAMGNTGRSTGPHLHYEIRDHGQAINPYSFTFLHR